MDNIKNFEDFLDRMQGLLDSAKKQGHIIVRVEDLENTFPELAESEDEKIRKAIHIYLDWLDGRKDYAPKGKYTIKDMITWLKKQGEQKINDNIEPKFKVGDWVVDNCGYVWKIEGILNQFYLLEGVEGGESRPTIEWVDKTFHLWTIQDAKDGDVLAAGPIDNYHFSFIAIYKNRGLDFFNSYCFIDFDGKFYEGDTGHALDDIHPATKEQYDLLLQKMHDAGYEFDFEQKELKEIELTKSESEEELSDFEAALFSAFSDGWQQYLHGEEVDFAQWAKEHSAELLEAANQNHVAWSEEDEDIRDTIIRDLKRLGGDMVTVKPAYKEEVDWLKSLKPQNHWKPTKDQMEALHDLNLTGNISYTGQGQVLIELYNDLYKISNVKDK